MHARVPFLATSAVVAAPSTLSPQRCWCLVMSEREQGGAHTIYTCRTPRAGLTVGCSSESWLREQFANTPTSCVPSDVLSTRPTRCWTRGCTVRAGARVRVADWVCARDALSVRRALTAWRWDALAHAVMSHDRGGARYWRSGCSNRAEGATRISVCPTLSPLESTKETRPATLVGRGAVNTRSMSFA